jgi:CpeS-like protein
MGDDGAMTLITTYSETESEERFWFASPNLRLRASVLKRWGGFSMATFSSEIRKSKPTAESANKAQRAWPSEQNAIPDWIQAEATGKAQELPTESA